MEISHLDTDPSVALVMYWTAAEKVKVSDNCNVYL